jgi:plastocyanin
MKRLLVAALALVAVVCVAAAAGAATTSVQITAAGFTPKTAQINAGDTVTWHNADTAVHQVVANNGSFASPVLKSGESWSHTFTAAGNVNYRDSQATKNAGTVSVQGAAPQVTLTSDGNTVTYRSGQTVTLSGTINNGAANEQVTLSSQGYGQTAAQASQTTKTTTANGAFEFTVSPSRQTIYTVKWKNATSYPVTIDVAPRVGFGRVGRNYLARVTSEIPYRGHFVFVQRHTAFGWKSIKHVMLGSGSRALFNVKLPHGRSVLRLFLSTQQAGPGYVASASRMLAGRR